MARLCGRHFTSEWTIARATRRASKGPALSLSKGFTLVELLIGATLSGAVMAAVLSSYVFLGRSFTRLSNQQILETEARRTLTYFARDVQAATSLSTIATSPTSPAANRVDLIVPVGTTTNTITYYYNGTASAAVVSINGSNVTMPAQTLVRCIYNGSSVRSHTLLRYITDNNASTASDLTIHYYDVSGREYAAATLAANSYLTSIRQLAMDFATQIGVSSNGTQTLVHRVTSSRMLIHNSPLLQ